MNKQHLHRSWHFYQSLRPWYFFAAAAVCGVVAVSALQSNYRHMDQLRQAVYTADENNSNVEGALQDLRSYVGSHMNTSLTAGREGVYPPIQLKYTYERLVQAAGQKTSSENSEIYSSAQKYCEQQIPTGFSGRYRLDCITNYVEQHGSGAVTNIPDSLYKFDFVSPRWSPDLAGWSIVFTALSLFLGVTLFVIQRVAKHR